MLSCNLAWLEKKTEGGFPCRFMGIDCGYCPVDPVASDGGSCTHLTEFSSVWILIATELHPREAGGKGKIGFLGMG